MVRWSLIGHFLVLYYPLQVLALYGHEQPTHRRRRRRRSQAGQSTTPSVCSAGATPRSMLVPTKDMRPYSELAAQCRSLEARVADMSAAMAKVREREREREREP
jgi:hypothetical protein